MPSNIKVEGVAFNLNDPDQVRLWQHAKERTNFSAYIKRLIQRDMENGNRPMVEVVEHEFAAEGFV